MRQITAPQCLWVWDATRHHVRTQVSQDAETRDWHIIICEIRFLVSGGCWHYLSNLVVHVVKQRPAQTLLWV